MLAEMEILTTPAIQEKGHPFPGGQFPSYKSWLLRIQSSRPAFTRSSLPGVALFFWVPVLLRSANLIR